jgi:hypothetical protein
MWKTDGKGFAERLPAKVGKIAGGDEVGFGDEAFSVEEGVTAEARDLATGVGKGVVPVGAAEPEDGREERDLEAGGETQRGEDERVWAVDRGDPALRGGAHTEKCAGGKT